MQARVAKLLIRKQEDQGFRLEMVLRRKEKIDGCTQKLFDVQLPGLANAHQDWSMSAPALHSWGGMPSTASTPTSHPKLQEDDDGDTPLLPVFWSHPFLLLLLASVPSQSLDHLEQQQCDDASSSSSSLISSSFLKQRQLLLSKTFCDLMWELPTTTVEPASLTQDCCNNWVKKKSWGASLLNRSTTHDVPFRCGNRGKP